jgi:Secretion system C-terminal sorting domain
MKPIKSLYFLFILVCLANYSMAAPRFWVAATASNWNNIANWSNASGGAGGFSVPAAGDAVTFDGGGLGNCTIDLSFTITNITVNAAYTGTISQGANSITTTGPATFGGGNFSGGSASISFGGTFTLSGTAVFSSTTAVLTFQNNTAFTSGTFNHNNGTVSYNSAAGGLAISGNSETFYNLGLVGQGFGINITSGPLTVSNTLTISGTSLLTINAGTINANGDIMVTNTATGGGGTGLINITGTLNQNFTGAAAAGQGALPQLTINKPSGTLNLINYPSVANNFTYTAGTINAGTSNFCFTRAGVNPYTITGSLTLNSISFIASANLTANIAAGTTLTCNADMSISGAGNLTLNTGTINVAGNLILTNTGAGGGGSATINMDGSTNQNMDGSAIAGNQSLLPNININATATVFLLGNISFSGNLTYLTGTINPGTSTCFIAANLTITGTFSIYNLTINRGANAILTIAAGSTVTTTNTLDLENGAFNISLNTGTIAAQGDIVDNNTGLGGGGSATILVNGAVTQNITSAGVLYEGSFPAVTISKPSGTLVFPTLITIRGNWTYTSGTLDVTTNNSTVAFGLSLTIAGNHTLNNVDFDAAGNYTYTINAGTTLTVNGNMAMSNSNNLTLNGGNINLNGDLNLTNTGLAGGGTTVLSFTGPTNQAITGALVIDQSRLPSVTINKPGGTLTFNSLITVRGNWTYTAGTMDVTTNGSTVIFRNTLSITGTHTLNNVTLAASGNFTYTVSTGTLLTVTGTLTTSDVSNVTLNTPVAGANAIQAQGNISITNTGVGGGTGAILINGAGAQAFTSTVASGQGRMPYINIQKPGGTLTLTGIISEARDWTYTSGTVDAISNASTVAFGGNNLTITSAGMSFYNVTISANTSTLANSMTVAGNLTVSNPGVLAPVANTINLAGNWTDWGTGGFTEATSTVNFNGTGLQTITSSLGLENFTNLTVNNTGTGIQLENNITTATTLSMTQGNIDLNNNVFTLGLSAVNSGSLSYTSGTMINSGSFTRWFPTGIIPAGSVTGLFPMGTSSNYRPFYVSAPVSGPSTGGTITVSYTDATTNTSVSISDPPSTVVVRKDLNWALSTANGLAGGTYNLQAQGTGFGLIGNPSDLRLTLVNSVVGVAGINAGTVTNPQVNRTGLSVANLTNTFYIGSINTSTSPLPVDFISFTVIEVSQSVKLFWQTSMEMNNDNFSVQRSINGSVWETFQTVPGSGNSDNISSYSATDQNPYPGTSFYRLMQTDFNGTVSYSPVRSIDLKNILAISIYPNPAAQFVFIQSVNPATMQINLYNSNGQIMNVPLLTGGSTRMLDVSELSTGVYFLSISQGDFNETRKLIIKK